MSELGVKVECFDDLKQLVMKHYESKMNEKLGEMTMGNLLRKLSDETYWLRGNIGNYTSSFGDEKWSESLDLLEQLALVSILADEAYRRVADDSNVKALAETLLEDVDPAIFKQQSTVEKEKQSHVEETDTPPLDSEWSRLVNMINDTVTDAEWFTSIDSTGSIDEHYLEHPEKLTQRILEVLAESGYVDPSLDAVRRLEAVRRLVEEELPQVPMTLGFRRRFYDATGFKPPEWLNSGE